MSTTQENQKFNADKMRTKKLLNIREDSKELLA
jgi:hypothetical protein